MDYQHVSSRTGSRVVVDCIRDEFDTLFAGDDDISITGGSAIAALGNDHYMCAQVESSEK